MIPWLISMIKKLDYAWVFFWWWLVYHGDRNPYKLWREDQAQQAELKRLGLR